MSCSCLNSTGSAGRAPDTASTSPEPDVREKITPPIARSPAMIITGMIIAGLLAIGGVIFSLTSGSGLVLAVSGARPADPVEFKQLHDIVEALAIGDGLPKPAVYVIDDPHPNAFATGTSPKRAA